MAFGHEKQTIFEEIPGAFFSYSIQIWPKQPSISTINWLKIGHYARRIQNSPTPFHSWIIPPFLIALLNKFLERFPMTDITNKPLILIDGSSYLFRAFYALPNLTNATGQPTGAILGVINMLKSLLTQYDPEYIAVVFDTKGPNFRHRLYPDYKANRSAMPEDLASQIEPIFEFIDALGLVLIKQMGIEADDLIATLAHTDFAEHHEILIATGDKDLAQLVNSKISLIDTMKNVRLDIPGVKEKFGVTPEQIIDYLALMGDTSDNIPGIPGVGPKTAIKWISEYSSLDLIIQNADKISGKVGENLRANLSQLELARKLVTVDSHVPLEFAGENFTWEKLLKRPEDQNKLVTLCEKYGFKTWLKNLGHEPGRTQGSPLQDNIPANNSGLYETILTLDQWNHWQEKISQSTALAIDTETTGLDPLEDRLVGVSFCVEPHKAAYLPLGHDLLEAPDQLSIDQILPGLKKICENPKLEKIGHHLKFDWQVLAQHGIIFQDPLFDSLLASYVLEAGQTRHNLETLALRHLNLKTISYESITGKGVKQLTFNQVPLDQATQYSAEDADITFQLYQKFKKTLHENPTLEKLFREEELPMLKVLARMELHGVLLDVPALQKQSQALGKTILEIENNVQAQLGMHFNLSSPKQLQTVLFEKLQLKPVKKTATGQASTDEEVLQILAEQHEIPKLLLEHRHLSKLKTTYTDKLPLMVNPKTNRVHTRYHQAFVVTGRLSSSDPNLQNIPIKSPQGRQIRQAFIAPPGSVILSADYSQIELRIMAHLSQDLRLIQAFKNGEDIHQATAAEVFGVENPSDVTSEQRRRAKAVNFGLIYGMSAFGLAKQLGIERSLAQHYIETYFARYPGVKKYMEETREQAKSLGYVETIWGRRLALPDIHSKNAVMRQGAERAAINAPMQGSAADIIKRAMIQIDQVIETQKLPMAMTLQVHDELVFEVQEQSIQPMTALIRHLMTSSSLLSVPLEISINTGAHWDEAH